MNNDLISRSELKKAIEQGEGFSWDSLGKDDLCVRKKYIDNAPTVEPPKQLVLRARNDAELEQLKTAWGNGEICFTPIVAYTARPQGEWISHWSEDLQKMGFRQCSICKAGCQIYEHGTRKSDLPWIDGQQYTLKRICNFCPNCGAKMKGGAKDEAN